MTKLLDRHLYRARGWRPKYNCPVSPHSTGDASFLRMRLRSAGWLPADARAAAKHHEELGLLAAAEWSRRAEAASQTTFGRPYQITDYIISGVARAEFSEDDKNALRSLAFASSTHASAAHDLRKAAKYWRI